MKVYLTEFQYYDLCVVKLFQMAQRHIWFLLLSPIYIPLHSLSIELHWVVAGAPGALGLLHGGLIVSLTVSHFEQKHLPND